MDIKVVILVGGRLVKELFFVRGNVYFEGYSEDLCVSFSFLSISNTLHLVYWSCDNFDIHFTYICFIYTNVCSFTYLSMCCFFSIFIHMFLIYCMQSIISVSHKDVMMSFV